MTDGVTIITCTGGRPEAFSLCAKFVDRQTWRGSLQWIVVDDTEDTVAVPPRDGYEIIAPLRIWKPGQNTLGINLLSAMGAVQYDKVLFIEDDDWYSPDYVQVMADRLDDACITGETQARYYHVPSRQYWQLDNSAHASLCSTGIRCELLPVIRRICESPDPNFIDVRLWESVPGFLRQDHHTVGIKGLPGRPGIGIGHRPDMSRGDWHHDPNLIKLREWVGDDVALYEPFMVQRG